MVEKILAAFGLLACLVALAGMLVGPARLGRWRAWLMGSLRQPKRRSQARREAEQAIERARSSVTREGNVYRPKSFNGRRPDDEKLH